MFERREPEASYWVKDNRNAKYDDLTHRDYVILVKSEEKFANRNMPKGAKRTCERHR